MPSTYTIVPADKRRDLFDVMYGRGLPTYVGFPTYNTLKEAIEAAEKGHKEGEWRLEMDSIVFCDGKDVCIIAFNENDDCECPGDI